MTEAVSRMLPLLKWWCSALTKFCLVYYKVGGIRWSTLDVGFKINKDKRKCMLSGSNRQHETHTTLNDYTQEIVKSCDYLGHVIKCDLRDDLDIQKRLNNCMQVLMEF